MFTTKLTKVQVVPLCIINYFYLKVGGFGLNSSGSNITDQVLKWMKHFRTSKICIYYDFKKKKWNCGVNIYSGYLMTVMQLCTPRCKNKMGKNEI